ncbi:MAG: hypothetical protein D6681_11050 [Calditrichaeota bacterium]|nr:MAG: hypothetical protein D6681_11050 [Calditrichota bacterium]
MIIRLRYSILSQMLNFLLVGGLMLIPQYIQATEPPHKQADRSPDPDYQPIGLGTNRNVFIPGDAVKISTYPDTTTVTYLNRIFPIDDQGVVNLPIIGKVKISTMSEQELVDYLKRAYQDYLRYPVIQVTPMIRASVLGGVARPGLYYIEPERSLWDLIQMAGGTTYEDGLKNMKWKRDRKVVRDNLLPFLQSGVSLRRMGFRSGDQIWVKRPDLPGFWTYLRETVVPLLSVTTTAVTLYLAVKERRP